jgi:aryl-alcohol dehydrogenase-like predicted oxidoreductase
VREIIIGGAQFGHNYGTLENYAIPSNIQRIDILNSCLESGFKTIDLSQNYIGSAENLANTGLQKYFAYNTKINFKNTNQSDLIIELEDTLKTLGSKNFKTILIHDWHRLSVREKIHGIKLLGMLKKVGLSESVGISVYDTNELIPELEKVDLIQAPLNFFNLQFLDSELFNHLFSQGVHLQARSIFLQGLLLNENANYQDSYWKDFQFFLDYINSSQVSRMAGALEVYDSQDLFKSLVVGFLNPNHVQSLSGLQIRKTNVVKILREMELKVEFADPRNWQLRR